MASCTATPQLAINLDVTYNQAKLNQDAAQLVVNRAVDLEMQLEVFAEMREAHRVFSDGRLLAQLLAHDDLVVNQVEESGVVAQARVPVEGYYR